MASACPAGKLSRRAVLPHSSLGAPGVREGGLAVEAEPALESWLAGFDGACHVAPVRRFDCHHCQRDNCRDIFSAVA